MTASDNPDRHRDPDEPPVTVRDKRRIDPETGEVRASPAPADPDAPADPSAEVPEAEPAGAPDEVVELTKDLQRVSAEYANYRRRVDRDRLVAAESATGSVLLALLPVLDDIGRARDHGDLDGAFKAVAESLEATVAKVGLVAFGEVGEPFDPTVHEALLQTEDAEATEPSVAQVLGRGYRLGERVLRPARVAVALPPD